MYSKFPFSMENIPRQKSFGCLSLKFGCILTALIVILYTLLALSQGFAELVSLPTEQDRYSDTWLNYSIIFSFIAVHSVSFLLSAVMLIGALRDKASLIKPWVIFKSLQLIASVLMFVFFNTINMIGQFGDASLLYYAIAFLSLLIRFYMLILVASFYKQLIEDQEECERLKSLVNETWYSDA